MLLILKYFFKSFWSIPSDVYDLWMEIICPANVWCSFFFSDSSRASVSRLNPRLTIGHCISSSHYTAHSFLRAQTITRENPINDIITVCKGNHHHFTSNHSPSNYNLIKLVDSSIRVYDKAHSYRLTEIAGGMLTSGSWKNLLASASPKRLLCMPAQRYCNQFDSKSLSISRSFIEVITTCFVG